MKAAIIGYGKMGQQIAALLERKGHQVVLIVDEKNADLFDASMLSKSGAEVALEFSVPDAAFYNIITCIDAGVGVVSGTTGWLDRFEEVAQYCRNQQGALFYAPNYSIGVNIMFALNKRLASVMERFNEYDVTVCETHHRTKLDAPSGTAVALAEAIIEEVGRKKFRCDDVPTNEEQLQVISIRRDSVPGEHTVTYESESDFITLSHTAKSRGGFVEGAVMAAEFLVGKSGIFSMEQMLGFE